MVHTGPERQDDRRVISGIIHRFREGCRWRALPEEYGPYTTVFNRYNRWSQRGLWQRLFAALVECSGPIAHHDRRFGGEDASFGERRAQRGAQNQAIGRSRGGRTTKIHALVDEEGRPHAFLLTGGNIADIKGAASLLASIGPSEQLSATRATTRIICASSSKNAARRQSSPTSSIASASFPSMANFIVCATSSSGPSAV